MAEQLFVNSGTPRSPRVPLNSVSLSAPQNQIYLKKQKGGGVICFLSASIDRPLQEVFEYYAYNGYMTANQFAAMVIDSRLRD